MNGLEICLVIIGLIFVACSFLFSEHLSAGDAKKDIAGGVNVASVTEEIVKREVEAEVANVIDDKLEEMEIKLEKMTSEKLMAMGEFSEDIQKRISENHEEVMFLYNMLNDKEAVIKNTVRDIEAVKASVKQMAADDALKENLKKKQKASDGAKKEDVRQPEKTGVYTKNRESGADMDKEAPQNAEEMKPAMQAKKLAETAEAKAEKDKGAKKREAGNNNQMILKLYAQGQSDIEIAKELGLGLGEVRLVIDLFNSR